MLPAPEIYARRGMSPRWDLGFRASVLGAELSARIQTVRRGGLAVAFAPGLGFEMVPITNNGTDVLRLSGSAAAIVERRVGRRTSLILAATPALTIAAPASIVGGAGEATRLLFEPSFGIGVAIEVGGVVVWPEVNVTFPREVGGEGAWERTLFQGGIAIGR